MKRGYGTDVSQEKVAHDFDKLRDKYTELIDEPVSFTGFEAAVFIEVKSRYLLRLATEHFGDNSRIAALDLGCGIGAYHAGLAGAFGSLSAVDVSEQSVEYARKHSPGVEYRSYGGVRLPYEDESFDLIFAICVLHHVPRPAWTGFARETYRVVRPGGMTVVFEHNPLNPVSQYIVRGCPIDEDACLLRASVTSRLLAGAGFKECRSRTILSVPPVNSVTESVDRLLGHLPFGAQYYAVGLK